MRTILVLWIVIFLFVSSLPVASAYARDFSPPAWRGDPGTTFQQWLFEFDKPFRTTGIAPGCSPSGVNKTPWGQRAPPENIFNPYQVSTGICAEFKTLWPIAPKIDWLKTYFGKDGVWKLESERTFANFLNFVIPNGTIGQDPVTTIQIQVVYYSLTGAPQVHVHAPGTKLTDSNTSLPQLNEDKTDTRLPEGWLQHIALIMIDSCPRLVSVFIYPPESGEIFIDSVTIDTACMENVDQT